MQQRRSIAGYLIVLSGLLVGLLALGPVEIAVTEATAAPGSNLVFLPFVVAPGVAPAQVVTLTNAERARAGCKPLRVSSQLTAAAQQHTDDMAFNDIFGHTGSDGSTPWERITATGYEFSRAAENVAAGYASPEAVVAGWMNSDGHRANILDCALEEIGVGYRYLADDPGEETWHHYWTQDFATP